MLAGKNIPILSPNRFCIYFMPYSNYYKKSGLFHGSALNMMGTRIDVVMMGAEPLLSEVWAQITNLTERLHRMLNRFDAASEISRINYQAAQHPVELSAELWNILTDVKKYHRQTLGYFDVSLRDFHQVILDNNRRTVSFTQKDISLDLGGYAKGYALEGIRIIFLREGVTQSLVNFGNSSFLAVGAHPHGNYWGIVIENPYQPGQQLKICELCNQSLSVSGNSTLHTRHIMNPRSGIFTNERKMVSAISNNAIEDEVITTALMVADKESVLSIKKTFENVAIDIWDEL